MSEIRMDYGLMEDMARTFRDGVNVLEDAENGVRQIVIQLEDDTLLGQGGDAFAEACRDRLAPAIARLREKLAELAVDVANARNDMLEADQEAESLY